MAKVIQSKLTQCEKMLQLISLKEILQIYCQSVLIVFYIGLMNFYKMIKTYFDKRVRQAITRQITMLSVVREFDSESKNNNKKNEDCQSISPLTMSQRFGAHKYIKIKTTRFHYVESGSTNSSTILLLHGFPDCFFGWRNQISVLSQTHRVIALDLKGFNDSDKPSMRYHYRPERICDELKLFLEAINVQSVCIIGHDIGAVVGWIFACKFPDNMNKFISINTPHPNLFWNPTKGGQLTKYFFNMVQIPMLPEKELNKNHSFIRETYSHLIDEMSNEISHGFKREDLIETYEYIFSRTADWTGALNYFRNFLFYRISPSYCVRCPCIIIFGTENKNFNLESAIKSAEYCENPLVKIIDGAGYFAHQTNATELNAILLKYLVGDNENGTNEECQEGGDGYRKSLMKRVINKVYSVGQQYGTSHKIFS